MSWSRLEAFWRSHPFERLSPKFSPAPASLGHPALSAYRLISRRDLAASLRTLPNFFLQDCFRLVCRRIQSNPAFEVADQKGSGHLFWPGRFRRKATRNSRA